MSHDDVMVCPKYVQVSTNVALTDLRMDDIEVRAICGHASPRDPTLWHQPYVEVCIGLTARLSLPREYAGRLLEQLASAIQVYDQTDHTLPTRPAPAD